MELGAGRHGDIRQKLDALGFCQPLPTGALGLVGAILEDLLKTTDSLKKLKNENKKLLEEKNAWELGVEPYKCDNSKLLAENSSLHLENIKQRDRLDFKNLDLIKKIRSLEQDKTYLEEHNSELGLKIRELEIKYTDCLRNKNHGVMTKVPFIATVPSGYILPRNSDSKNLHGKNVNCMCAATKREDILQQMAKLQGDIKNQDDMMESYKQMLNHRDQEIQRLSSVLNGGRSPTVLAKDCCYKGVGSLTESVQSLQKQNSSLTSQLKESIKSQHESKQRAIDLADQIQQLKKELKNLEITALNVESQANLSILDKEQHNSELKIKITESEQKIQSLEEDLYQKTLSSINDKKLDNKNALKKAIEENKKIMEKYNEIKMKEKNHLNQLEKIARKNLKLKEKLANLETNPIDDNSEEINRIKSERSYYQKEYLKLQNKLTDVGVEDLKQKLSDQSLELSATKSELNQLKFSRKTLSEEGFNSNRSVQASIHRIERERDIAKAEIQRLQFDRDSLRSKLDVSTEVQMNAQRNYDEVLNETNQRIAKLESERNQLMSSQVPSQATISILKQDLEALKGRLEVSQHENSQIRTKYSQIKILQEQTERALQDHQNGLIHTEHQLGHAESRLNMASADVDKAQQDIFDLKNEVATLKTCNQQLETGKDKLVVELDEKTEKIYRLEVELKRLVSGKQELQFEVDQLRRKYENTKDENLQKNENLHEATSQTNSLKKQMSTLKRNKDNLVSENSRLVNDLTEVSSEASLTKRKLFDSQKEVERLKSQLQQYVQEVQKAEDLLAKKDSEREEMLDHYRSLSHDAIVLEGNNHSLELEAAEKKKLLDETEDRLNAMKSQLDFRENEVKSYERQITDLSNQITEFENNRDENKNLKADLDAMKELCNKLDLQKDKLNAELTEHSTIRQQLERENEKLKSELKLTRTGDKASVDGLQELLAQSRQEIEQQRLSMSHLNQEVVKLRDRVHELEEQLTDEHMSAIRNEALAREYSVQVQELRHSLTNDRFEMAHSREEACRIDNPTKRKSSSEKAFSVSSKIQITKSYKSFENSLNSNSSSNSSNNSKNFQKNKKRNSSSFQIWANDLQNKLNQASRSSESEEFDELLDRRISTTSIPRLQILSLESLSISASSNTSVFSTANEDLPLSYPEELEVKPIYDTSHLRPPPSYFPLTPKISIRITSNVGPIKSFSGTCNVQIEKKSIQKINEFLNKCEDEFLASNHFYHLI